MIEWREKSGNYNQLIDPSLKRVAWNSFGNTINMKCKIYNGIEGVYVNNIIDFRDYMTLNTRCYVSRAQVLCST